MESLIALLILFFGLVRVSVVAFSSSYDVPIIQPYTKVSPSYQRTLYQTKNIKTSLVLSSTATDATTIAPTSNTLGVTVGDTKGAFLLLGSVVIYTNGGDLILKNVNLRVEPNERWGIVGPNGCGKRYVSTLYYIFSIFNASLSHRNDVSFLSGIIYISCKCTYYLLPYT